MTWRKRACLWGAAAAVAACPIVLCMTRGPTGGVATPAAQVGAAPEAAMAPSGEAPPSGARAPRAPSIPEARPRAVEPMSGEELSAEASRLEARLSQEDAIERLNRGTVTAAERHEYGVLLEREAALRRRLVELDLEAMAAEVADYESGHEARLERLRSGERE